MVGRVSRWSWVRGDSTRHNRGDGSDVLPGIESSDTLVPSSPSLPIAMALTRLAAAHKDSLSNSAGLQFAVRILRSDALHYAAVRVRRRLFL